MSPIQPGEMASYGALPIPHITPELLSLIRTGSVYSLAVTYYEGMPVPGPMVPYTLSPCRRRGDLSSISPASAAAEAISMSTHTGTHIDALCHMGEHQNDAGEPDSLGRVQLYNVPEKFIPASDSVTFQGHTPERC
jgi:hypothetical protein